MLELYENIKKYRKLNKMTQDELAKLTGYTDRSSIAKIEKGDVDLPQRKILLFAKALGVAPGDLMGNTGIIQEETETYEYNKSLLDLLSNMTDQEKQELIDYMKYLISKRPVQ